MKIAFANLAVPTKGAAVVTALDGSKLTKSARQLNKKTGGAINRAIRASRFRGKMGQSLTVLAPQGTTLERILILGLGKPKEIDARALQDAGGCVSAALSSSGSSVASMLVERIDGCNLSAAEMSAQVGFGARLRSYRFNKYRTMEKSKYKPTLTGLNLLCNRSGMARKRFAGLDKIANGVFMTRDVISEPPNILYPETLAKRSRELTKLGVRVEQAIPQPAGEQPSDCGLPHPHESGEQEVHGSQRVGLKPAPTGVRNPEEESSIQPPPSSTSRS